MFFKKTNNKEPRVKKPASKKRIAITSSIIGVCAIALGAGAGYFAYTYTTKSAGGDYSNVNANALTDDISKAQAKLETAKTSGAPLEEALKPSEMVNLALNQFSEIESTKTVGLGSALSVGVTQVIQSMQIKNGDRYFEESNSMSSFVKLYDRMYQEGDTTTTYWGESSDYASHTPATYTNEEYADFMGRKVSDAMIYVISTKTVITDEAKVSSSHGVSRIEKEEGGYVVDLELKTKAVVNYVKQMKKISGLTGYPTFEYCHLTFHLSEDLMPISYTSYEKYNATKESVPLPVDIEGSLTTLFYYGETYEIPSLDAETQSVYENFGK